MLGISEVEILDALTPPGVLAAVVKEARRAGSVERGVVAVGHEPTMGEWVGELCFGKRGYEKFKKGGIAAVKLAGAGAKGELLALWDPRTLRNVRVCESSRERQSLGGAGLMGASAGLGPWTLR